MGTFKRIVLIALILAMMAGASATLTFVDVYRSLLGQFSVSARNQPPEVVLLTHLLGGFRGLLIDAVWLRASRLQQEEKYWELYQLYDWMGKLEPSIEEIWDFNGWNMAYNLVAELPDSEARWQWIQRALDWLRNDGLYYNPKSGLIMDRIAWIYYHKIGRDLDLHNAYYKHRWALLMHDVVGSREQQDVPGMEEASHWTLTELLADADVKAALAPAFTLDPPDEPLKQLDKASGLSAIPQAIGEAIIKAKNVKAVRKIANYVAMRVLRDRYKMDRFDIMVQMEKDYGKFDWRLPEPHAIYWVERARENMLANPTRKEIDYDRILLASLQETMRRGVIAYMGSDPEKAMVTAFDLSKAAPINKLYEMMTAKTSIASEAYGAASIQDGHVTFLQEITFDMYFAGYQDESRKYYEELNTRYDKPNPRVPLDEYVLGFVLKLVDENGTHAKVRAWVDGCIVQSCFFLCVNKRDEAATYEDLARRGWEAYRQYGIANATGRTRNDGLDPFPYIEREVVLSILRGEAGFPKELIPALRAIVGVPEGKEKELTLPGQGIAPKIAPSSPPPK